MIRIENHGCTDSESSESEPDSKISVYSQDLSLEGYLDWSRKFDKYREDVYLNKVIKAIKLGKNNLYDKINALSIACEENREDVVKELLKFDDVLGMIRYDNDNDDLIESAETIDKSQKTLFDTDNKNIVSLLLENGINIKTYGGKALRSVASNGHIKIIQLLLDYGVPIDEPDKKNGPGSTALTSASISGQKDAVTLLLKRGADIHISNDHPLCMASYHGRLEIVELLIDNGANVKNSNALYKACFTGKYEIVKILLENGASVTNESLYAALGNPQIVSLLLEFKKENLDVNEALYKICSRKYGNVETVKLLLKAGAVVDDKIIKAAYYGNPKIMTELLIGSGLIIYEGEELEYAICKKDMKMINLLIQDPKIEEEFIGEFSDFAENYYEWLEENYRYEYEEKYNEAIEKNMKLHEDGVLDWNRMILRNKFSDVDKILKENKDSLMLEFRGKLEELDIVKLKRELWVEDIMEMYRYEAAG